MCNEKKVQESIAGNMKQSNKPGIVFAINPSPVCGLSSTKNTSLPNVHSCASLYDNDLQILLYFIILVAQAITVVLLISVTRYLLFIVRFTAWNIEVIT